VATIEDVRQLHDVPRSGATGEGVTVAVMDSGVDIGHPVFSDVPVEQVDVTGSGNGDVSGEQQRWAGRQPGDRRPGVQRRRHHRRGADGGVLGAQPGP
jgi:subtilisin family serine protease